MSLDNKTTLGARGQIASQTLMHSRRLVEPQAQKVREDLYCIRGLNICNTQVVCTPEGIVIVDTGRSSADGEAILEMVAGITDDPIIAVIYSHSHYTMGTAPILSAYPDIPIVAHHKVHENITRSIAGERRFMTRRARMESARFLPEHGPDADSTGSRIHSPGTMSYVKPTVEIVEDVETIAIGGVEFTIHTTYPFDTDDTIFIWLPDRRAILHNHFSDNFPNVYPIQGGRYRDPIPWLDGLDRMRQYQPQYLLSTHGAPSTGADTCSERLTYVRDALQFVHDQTIRGMNQHMEPNELVDFVSLPDSLRESLFLHETYGDVANHVRGIYAGLAGWYDGSADSIYPPSPDEEAACLVRDLGGIENAISKLESAIERDEYRWAARLGRLLFRYAPYNGTIQTNYAHVLRYFGYHTTAWTVRNYYLSQARIVDGQFTPEEPSRTVDTSMALLTNPGTFVRALGYRVNPSRLPDQATTLQIEFGDIGFTCWLVLRNGIAEYRESPDPKEIDENSDASDLYTIRCTRSTWIDASDCSEPFSRIADNNEVVCRPSREAVRTLLTVFD